MIIYRMTATFGKLEQETLTLTPGMNIIEAGNEWGKSTWCAFLTAMLYGLDTRAKTTKTTLADKERYAPWSGSPMAGRMDLNWKGRDITIERATKGRVPLGAFRAYETATGLTVPELTAANCGQLLLGVECSVFRRAGFIRLNDMPVTQDDALRRRLNALVTTGDESGDGERLERSLRELKNKCRYNRIGLLPQAEAEREAVQARLSELDGLEKQTQKLNTRLEEVTLWKTQLENHRNALQYTAAQADAQLVEAARKDLEQLEEKRRLLEQSCEKLPSRETAEQKLRELREFQESWNSTQMEVLLLPEAPDSQEAPPPFTGLEPEAARQMLSQDVQNYRDLRRKKPGLAGFVVTGLLLMLAVGLLVLKKYFLMAGCMALAVLALGLGNRSAGIHRRKLAALEEKYGAPYPEDWQDALEAYIRQREVHLGKKLAYQASRGDLDARLAALQTRRQSLCGAQSPERVQELWQQVLQRWEEYHSVRREVLRAQSHLETLHAMAKTAQRPAMEDTLTYTQSDTLRLISDAAAEQQRLQNRMGQHQGRMEALGDRSSLEKQLTQISQKISTLEEIYAAAELALHTLTQAKRELQRRFAPRISKRAQELLGEMTGGRYQHLTLGEDFTLLAGTGEETVLHEALWRSEGTVDQLYLALRLAVAEALTPTAPLVLDDALVRFDDARLKAVLSILQAMAKERQILLFTCQSRENQIMQKGEGK